MSQTQLLPHETLLEMMAQHNLVAKIGRPLSDARKCPCCSSDMVETSLPIGCQVSDFVHVGVLFPLYFEFILYFSGLLLICSLFSIISMCLNVMGEQCQDDKSLPCLTSISNILGNSDINYLNVETIINYFFIVASVIYLEFMTYILNQRRLKLEVPSEHHYAVLYKGDRTSTSAELYESLKELEISVEKTLGRKNRILKVGIIMRVYESDVIKKSQVITDGASGESSDILLQYSFVDHTEKPNIKIEADYSGKVIIIFEYPIRASQLNNPSILPMTTATDVTWENIGLRGEQSKKILMLMLIALLMVATFVAILFFKKWIKKVSTGYHEVFVIFLNLCIATVVAIFNSIEGIVIRAFARKELYPYQSKFFKIVAKRLSYVFFTNMVLTTFFANFLFFFESSEKSKLFLPIDYAGLVNDFFVLFLTNSYMSSIFNYLDIFYGIKLLKRRRITRDPLHNPYSADSTRFIFEGHPVDMGLRYGNVLKTLFFTASISPFVPSGPLMSLLGMLICYWVDKYLLLRRYTCRYELAGDFAEEMTEFSKFFVVLFAFSNFVIQLVPLNNVGQPDSSEFSWVDLYLSAVLFALTLIYKFYFRAIRMYFKKKGALSTEPQLSYIQASQYFRSHFEDKLTMTTLEEMSRKSTNMSPMSHTAPMDQKLMETVKLSIIQNKFDEDTI